MNVSSQADHIAHNVYVVATIRPWNVDTFQATLTQLPGKWHLLTSPTQLTVEYVARLKPRYIFFPHWSEKVPPAILSLSECVCFHETDLPYGRGGSPIQNLIVRGHSTTQITALRMVDELDAGPVYMKRPLSLEGRAEDIFIRASHIIAGMMQEIVKTHPVPVDQTGTPTVFRRRTPAQSEIHSDIRTPAQLYDHIRMLDAPEYPPAFADLHGFRMHFGHASYNPGTDEVTATVIFKPKDSQG